MGAARDPMGCSQVGDEFATQLACEVSSLAVVERDLPEGVNEVQDEHFSFTGGEGRCKLEDVVDDFCGSGIDGSEHLPRRGRDP